MTTDTDLKIAAAIERVRTEIANLRADMERLRADMEKRFNEQTQWIITWATVLVIGAVGVLIRFG